MKTLSKNTQPRPHSNYQSSSPSTPTSRPWLSKLSWLWLVAFGLLGVYLLTQRRSHQASSGSSARSVSSRSGDTATSEMPRVGTRPIETLQVGDRVLAFNPELSHAERQEIVEPQWWDWLHLSLSMPKADGSLLEIELLRPEKWVREQIRLAVAPQAAELFNGKPYDVCETSFQRHGASRPVPSDFVDGYRATRAAPLESELHKPESQDLVPLSPLRPIFLELAAVGAELKLSGEELQALLVEMDLPELAITGPAVVKQIQNAPAIQPGDGRVITATFKHSSGDVIDLRVGDASEPRIASNTPPVVRVAHRPNELGSANLAAASASNDAADRAEAIGLSDSDDSNQVIGTTSNHPFWSVDRREYVQADKLEHGERVLTYSGDTKRVLSKLARPGPQPVYNLEVFAEHVYYVGKDGVLVHNQYFDELADLRYGGASRPHRPQSQELVQDAIREAGLTFRKNASRSALTRGRELSIAEDHHIASHFRPELRQLFESAGLNIKTHELNIVKLNFHTGPHMEEYHEFVFRVLSRHVGTKTGKEAATAIDLGLGKLSRFLERHPTIPNHMRL